MTATSYKRKPVKYSIFRDGQLIADDFIIKNLKSTIWIRLYSTSKKCFFEFPLSLKEIKEKQEISNSQE